MPIHGIVLPLGETLSECNMGKRRVHLHGLASSVTVGILIYGKVSNDAKPHFILPSYELMFITVSSSSQKNINFHQKNKLDETLPNIYPTFVIIKYIMGPSSSRLCHKPLR
jgi:hypothetical protein